VFQCWSGSSSSFFYHFDQLISYCGRFSVLALSSLLLSYCPGSYCRKLVFVHCPSLLSFREFLFSTIRLPITLGFLVHYSHVVRSLWFREFLFQMPLESLVCNSCAVHPPITWGVFILMSLECLVHGSYTVHSLLLRECLVQCCWIALCAIRTLFIPYCFWGIPVPTLF